MNPIAEDILRALAIGRSKTAALVRAALKADGIIDASCSPDGLSMSAAAVRQRRSREQRRLGSVDPVTDPVTVTPDVTTPLSLSSSSDLKEIQERERRAHKNPVTLATQPVTQPIASEFHNENESSVRTTRTRKPSEERDNVHAVTSAKSRITAQDPLTEALVAIARDAGVDDSVTVWRKYTAFRDGQDREMPKDWRLWCLRERGQPTATTNKETASEVRLVRANEGLPVLLPESECASVEETIAHAEKLRATLAKAGYGGVRKVGIPPPPLLEEIEDERREAAQ
jgi:hypothetical protein